MAKTQQNAAPVVYHKSMLTDEIRNSGKEYSYTENWAFVTDAGHLAARQKELLKAEKETAKVAETKEETK